LTKRSDTELDTATLRAILSEHLGIDVRRIDPQPGGQDERSTVYRAWAAKGRNAADEAPPGWIVKVRRAEPRARVAARTVAFLHDTGLPHVVAPVRSLDGGVPIEFRCLAVTVLPFLEATHGAEVGLGGDQWRELGRFTQALHQVRLPAALRDRLRRDRYHPRELGLAKRVDHAAETDRIPPGGVPREVAGFWLEHRATILDLARRTEALGERLRTRRLPRLLTHGDLHTYNILVDEPGGLWVVDWDELLLAPPERDLMFFVGGIAESLVGARATAAFLEGYGDRPIDPLALAYYRHAWAIQDIAGYAARVLLGRRADEAGQREAARILAGLFRPGEIVDLAIASLDRLGNRRTRGG
jgi:spectinomycin phosphotransferase